MSVIFNITVLGSGAVGKSAITVRYANDHFVEKYDPTVEDSYRKQVSFGERSVMVEIADTAGQEEYRSLLDSYIINSDVILLVGSVDSTVSPGKLE